MARNRNPKRDEALKIFVDRNGEVSNRELASFLSVPEKTISAWKSRDKWNAVLQKDKGSTTNGDCSTTKKVGAPVGNKNAKGNKGNSRASPPLGNKNAVKTGEFEKIYFDLLSDDEKAIYSADFSFSDRLEQDIQELTMRKYRMMKRIKNAEDGLDLIESEKLYELRGRKQYVDSLKGGKKISIEVPQVTMTEMKEKSVRKIEDILRIEDALTRISNQLARSIKQLEEITLNEKRLQVFDAQIKKLKAETNEIGGASSGDEVKDWKQAVISAANKRAVKEDE